MTKSKLYSIALNHSLLKKIKEKQESEDISRNEIVNDAIIYYIDLYKKGEEITIEFDTKTHLTVQIFLDVGAYEELKKLQKKDGHSVNEHIKRAIDSYLS